MHLLEKQIHRILCSVILLFLFILQDFVPDGYKHDTDSCSLNHEQSSCSYKSTHPLEGPHRNIKTLADNKVSSGLVLNARHIIDLIRKFSFNYLEAQNKVTKYVCHPL